MNKKLIFLIIILATLFYFLAGWIWLAWTTEGYQAVFLDNGQVYFGKLSHSGRWLKLSDIFYLQTQSLQQNSGTGDSGADSDVQLIKLGSELHGPEDIMYIKRDHVLFWENLEDDSKVVDAINKYNSK
jgi:hypothetical protein